MRRGRLDASKGRFRAPSWTKVKIEERGRSQCGTLVDKSRERP